MTKILAINGSYRDDGMTVQAVDALAQELEEGGADVETINCAIIPSNSASTALNACCNLESYPVIEYRMMACSH